MKNILKTLTVTAVMVGMSGGVALADSNCEITNTGSGSVNTCTSEETNDVRVSCVNGIYIVNNNDQEAGSGNGEVDGSTTGGNATSGNAVNENGTAVQIGASCGDEEVATPPAPTTPTTPGGGAGAGGQVLSAAVAGQQVAFKPVGGAGAGTGTGASSGSAAATTGVLASASLIAAGLALRKQALGRM